MRSPFFAFFLGTLVGTIVLLSQPVLSDTSWMIPASAGATIIVALIVQARLKKH